MNDTDFYSTVRIMEELNVALNYTFPVLPYNNTLTTQAYQKKKTKKTHGYLL